MMEFFEENKDYIMHEGRKDLAWESSVRLTLVGSNEDLGMFLEERDARKRKWQGEGKMIRREDDEREQRRMPPKKIMSEFLFYMFFVFFLFYQDMWINQVEVVYY